MPWIIDPARTHLGCSAKPMRVSTMRGQFKAYSGTIQLDEQDFTCSTLAAAKL